MTLRNEAAPVLTLDGAWGVQLGAQVGTIVVPGCWEAQGYSKHIDGPAHYRRGVTIPVGWAGQRILLEFDALSYAAVVRWNGQAVGEHRGLWTPFALDVTAAARCGGENQIEIEVYKPGERYPMRSTLAGFLPDVATTFGGLWQPARLRALTAGIDDLLIDPDPDTGVVAVRARAATLGADLSGCSWSVAVAAGDAPLASGEWPLAADGRLDAEIAITDPVLWSPAHPALYTVTVQLRRGADIVARATERIGFRRLAADGDQLLLNGRPICLRGALSWGWDPQRIAPAYGPADARAEMRRLRELGFNLVKLCLFVPNQAYFQAADEEGMLLWQEWPMWLPQVTPELRARAPTEYAGYMRLTRHHPSVILYSLGCELNASVDASLLGALDDTVRGLAGDTLVCDNSGSGESYGGLTIDFADFTDYHPYGEIHHFEPLFDHWRRDWRPPRPWIFGEFCDSDGFRDLGQLIAANGGVRPWWMTEDIPVHTWRPEVLALIEAEERLARADLGFTPQELVRIANAQSLMVRKYILEAVRRRAGMGGYVITGLRDTPLATSGIFDDLGRAKWSAEEFRPFNDDAILCLDGERRRRWQHGGDRVDRRDRHNWWGGDAARWHIILSHTLAPLPVGSRWTWRLSHLDGEVLLQGEATTKRPIAPGRPAEVGMIECRLPEVVAPCELRLTAEVTGGGYTVANHWPIWCYPRPGVWPSDVGVYDPTYLLADLPDDVRLGPRLAGESALDAAERRLVVATAWSSWLATYARAGGRVLLWQPEEGALPVRRLPFWREALKLFPNHPLWERFPHRGYADLQFWGLGTDAALDAARLGEVVPALGAVRPILRRLDAREFHVTEYLLEAEVGAGRLLACTLRLAGGAGAQPSSWSRNVAGVYLLWAMLDCLAQ